MTETIRIGEDCVNPDYGWYYVLRFLNTLHTFSAFLHDHGRRAVGQEEETTFRLEGVQLLNKIAARMIAYGYPIDGKDIKGISRMVMLSDLSDENAAIDIKERSSEYSKASEERRKNRPGKK